MPRIDTLVKLATSLECDANELFAGINCRPGSVRFGSFGEASDG